MIDSAMLKRTCADVSPRDPGPVCRELDADPAAIKEAASGMAFGQPPEVVGLVAIALLVGIKAGREAVAE